MTCQLYRHFDSSGRLLYVGIAESALRRNAAHSRSNWADAIASITILNFESREEAMLAEAEAIREERPLHNIKASKDHRGACVAETIAGTDLAFVKEALAACSREERKRLAAQVGKEPITIERIADGRTKYPRADVVGKLTIHFRTQEKQERAAA